MTSLIATRLKCEIPWNWKNSQIIYNLIWYAWIKGPGEWLSFRRYTSNLSWSWKKIQFLHYKYFCLLFMACQTLHYSIFLYFYRILLHYYCIFWDLYLISDHFYSICFVSILYPMICIQYIRLFLLYNFRLYCIFSHLHCIFLDLYLISGHFYYI